ncbi:AbrB/MazE/SpoVT family DNA-binding domain-containing protein [soil metagenome]
MYIQRHVRLFRNGRNQAIRIPREFEFLGKEVLLHKEGERLIIEPIKKCSFQEMLTKLAKLGPCDEDFPNIEELPFEDEEIF